MANANEILELEKARCQAMMSADVSRLSELFAQDLVWIHASAKVDSKQGVLNTIQSGKTKYLEINCTDQAVRFYDKVALVGGIANMRLEIAGEVRTLQNRYTITWFNDGGKWEVINWQSTSVPKPA